MKRTLGLCLVMLGGVLLESWAVAKLMEPPAVTLTTSGQLRPGTDDEPPPPEGWTIQPADDAAES